MKIFNNNISKFFSSDYYVLNKRYLKVVREVTQDEIDTFTRSLKNKLKDDLPKPKASINPKVQRALDLSIGSILAVPLGAAVGATALIMKITNKGQKVFHIQKRLGQNAKEFNIIKFRTVEKHPDGYRLKSGFTELLRKYSIDEMPQLWNVFKGDMSLVGPRPYIHRDIIEKTQQEGIDFVAHRTLLKPGFGFGYEKGRQTAIPKVEQEKAFIYDRGIKTYFKTLYKLAKTVVKGNNG